MRWGIAVLFVGLTVWLHLVFDNVGKEMPLLASSLDPEGAVAKLPPLGRFLSPFTGYLQNAESDAPEAERTLDMPGLQAPVQITWDDRMVPHIFAQNDRDLYYAQGYVTALMRLWQMDTQTRQAGGRLSEFVGAKALDTDMFFRRIGMTEAAERSVELMRQDPATMAAVEAYTAGINAYIQQIGYANYPIEYKLLGYAPEEWTPLKTALMLKLMAWTLTGANRDLALTNAMLRFGPAVVDSLYPNRTPFQDPIIPAGTEWDFDSVLRAAAPETPLATDSNTYLNNLPRPDPANGSNNWALHGSRSASGYPILANDPHLDLSLPSIWFEIQLSAPGVNVYGASLPGAPAVISGFNDSIAWGVTNVGADVMDWFLIKFKDETRAEYFHAGEWKPTKRVRQEIRVRGQDEPVVLDVLWTHHGPVVLEPGANSTRANVPQACALQWMAHQPGNEFLTFHKLNRSRNYADYVNALKTFVCPAQNFVFASAANDVALWCNGRYPLKWQEQGRYILDGTNSRHDWNGTVPHAHNPHVLNPPRGFVSSANQESTAPDYPYYLGSWYAEWERGARINQQLGAMQNATPDRVRQLQNDNFSMEAEKILPKLIELLETSRFTGTTTRSTAAQILKNWDYNFTADQAAPSIFDRWWAEITRRIWEDEFGQAGWEMPREDVTIYWLLTDSTLRWYDDTRTPNTRETPRQIVQAAFETVLDTLTAQYGDNVPGWNWGRVQDTYVPHLVQSLKPFGRFHLNAPGCPLCVNSTKPRNGPSWRMVVALHPNPDSLQAFGLYPGGQSGNPGSPWYDDMVDEWVAGRLYPLWFMRSEGDTRRTATSKWALNPVSSE